MAIKSKSKKRSEFKTKFQLNLKTYTNVRNKTIANIPAAGSSQVAFHSPASRSRGINQCTLFMNYLRLS